ncbi:MAG TPA: hypothetical protein PKY82_18160 [Pyrinomonadaceae bacterium]|nr:hypothetical protein [Pyrinomonadaceae bacterium]
MTKQRTQRRHSLLLATITAVFIFTASSFAQNGIGKKYNSRDPRPCSETPSKTKAPTIAEAIASVICNSEHESGIETLFLVDDVKVTQIGKGTPYKRGAYANISDIDVDYLIYPIRGSYKKYQCTLSDGKTPEKSCLLYDETKAEGNCYKNTFGQWKCGLSDLTVKDSIKVFPPGIARATANNTPAEEKPVTTKNGNQTTDKPVANQADRDENGFPKPDFSEMEKYFEIVRTDYDFSLGRFNMLVKATKKTNVFEWYMTFYDADGIKVMDRSFNASMGSPELGEPTKIYGYTPTEKEMKQVTRIVITRKPF